MKKKLSLKELNKSISKELIHIKIKKNLS